MRTWEWNRRVEFDGSMRRLIEVRGREGHDDGEGREGRWVGEFVDWLEWYLGRVM